MSNIETFAPTGNGQETATFAFGKLAESISALVFLAEVHRNKDSGFYSFHELFRTSHIVFPDAVVHWKHGYVYRRGGLLEVLHLGKEVAFRFPDFLWGGLFTPMPVIQVSGMKQPDALQVDQKRDAHVRGAECFDTDIRVFVHITFIYIGGILTCGTTMFQDVLGEDVVNIRALGLP